MLLSASTSFIWTAAPRDNDRDARFWGEKLENQKWLRFGSVSGFTVNEEEGDEIWVKNINQSNAEMLPRVTQEKRSARADRANRPDALLWSTLGWPLQSSSSGLRSRWVLGQFQVSRRCGRNHGICFCKRSTEEFNISKRGKSGKTILSSVSHANVINSNRGLIYT